MKETTFEQQCENIAREAEKLQLQEDRKRAMEAVRKTVAYIYKANEVLNREVIERYQDEVGELNLDFRVPMYYYTLGIFQAHLDLSARLVNEIFPGGVS